jgi:C1A family cysteine protease
MMFLFALLAVVSASNYEAQFKTFLNDFNKVYEGDEIAYRFNVFVDNVIGIEEHNVGNHSWMKGINQFTDLTQAEFEAIYLGYVHRERAAVEAVPEVPHADIDWRGKGAMTPIKDQGQCGSCWAFSTTGGVEGAEFVKSGSVTSLSEQSLVDCSGSYGNQGCNGGLMDNAFKFIKAKGIPTETSYPYTAKDGSCKSYTSATKISTYTDVTSLAGPLATQPISVAVDASKWSSYRSGTYSCSGRVSLDHGVLLAGSYSGYWIIKNSWGSSWGLNGFMQLSKTSDCGVTQAASYPTI